jgi:tubulin polyglutamylase TTLL6/13
MCFEILGIDVIIDNNLKPWLLEVNHTPSFTTDTPFDYDIKFNLIKDTI